MDFSAVDFRECQRPVSRYIEEEGQTTWRITLDNDVTYEHRGWLSRGNLVEVHRFKCYFSDDRHQTVYARLIFEAPARHVVCIQRVGAPAAKTSSPSAPRAA